MKRPGPSTINRMKRFRIGSSALAWVVVLLALPGWLVAAFEKVLLPVPILVDSEEVFTDLRVEVAVDELGFPLIGRSPAEDSDEEVMLQFFEALVAGEWEAAERLTLSMPHAAPEANMQLFEAYEELLAEAKGDIQIERVVALGDDRLLVWSVPHEGQPGYPRFIRSFRFLRQTESGTLLYEGPRQDPLSVLLTNLYQEAQTLTDGVPLTDPDAYEFSYDIPIENNGEPPRFLFNGEIVDTDIFGPPPLTLEPDALNFYRAAMRALSTGDPSQYAPFFSPESRTRFEDWVAGMEAGAYSSYREDMEFIGKRIYFVLNADPVYLLFHLPTFEGIEGAAFRYNTVWRNPAGEWQVINFYIEGFFDDIVKNRGLFEEPFLRPRLVAEGLLDDERESLAIVRTFGDDQAPADPSTSASPSPPVPDPSDAPEPDRRGLPLWVWLLIAFLVIALAIFLRRLSAASADANSSST
jgi:hypothetical protein